MFHKKRKELPYFIEEDANFITGLAQQEIPISTSSEDGMLLNGNSMA
jgi:hypothetical protein